MAAFARSWEQSHPGDFLFEHYFGATPESAAPDAFLRRLLEELKARFKILDALPRENYRLAQTMLNWLRRAADQARILLVLDGLDQVAGSEPDRRLLFLPTAFPQNVAVLASAPHSPALESLRERGWAQYCLPQASDAEVDAMVGEYLTIHARTLEPALRHQLVTAAAARNPLFLRTVLEELRQLGKFEELSNRVRYYLEADNPRDLFLRVLARWEEDFDQEEQGRPRLELVRPALTLLWASRQGLAETEWLDLLGDGTQPLPRAFLTPLFLAMDPHLTQRKGLFTFGHDFLRQAVEARFLPAEEQKRAAHLAVADYFERHSEQRGFRPRKAAEWPYQLQTAEAWDRLEACLTDIPLFVALYADGSSSESTAYWKSLQSRHPDLSRLYADAYARWNATPLKARDHYIPMQIGQFLCDTGYYKAAEPLLRRGLEAVEQVLGPDHPDTLVGLNGLGELLENQGDTVGAEALYRRAWEKRERVLGPMNPYTIQSLSNLGQLLFNRGDLSGAEPFVRRAQELSEQFLGEDYPLTLACMKNLADLHAKLRQFGTAETLYRRALSCRDRGFGRDHPWSIGTLIALAGLLQAQGRHADAEPFVRRAVETAERTRGDEDPDVLQTLMGVAALLQQKGEWQGADSLYRRAVEISSNIFGAEHRHTVEGMNRLALVLLTRQKYDEAEPLFQKALGAAERILGPDHRETLNSANGLAAALFHKQDYAEAESLFRRVLEGRERAMGSDNPELVESIHNLAMAASMTGESGESEVFFRRGIALGERHLGAENDGTLRCVISLAELLVDIRKFSQALPLYERAVESLQKISIAAGSVDPRLRPALTGYVTCLRELGCTEVEIRDRLQSLICT